MNDSIAGNLLVATAALDGTRMQRSVCLVVHQDEARVIGVVLNRPLKGELTGESTEGQVLMGLLAAQEIHFGGPSAGPVLALHNCKDLGDAETGTGLYMAATREHVERLVSDEQLRYRLFVGHVEWSIAELHSQLTEGQWAVLPASADVVFASDETMWPQLMRQARSIRMAALVGAKHIPPHPAMN